VVPVAEPIDRVWAGIAGKYPALHLVRKPGEQAKIIGSIVITDEGAEIDRFSVRIDLAPLAHGNLPNVYETGGRIPRTPARHMNGTEGPACVCLELDYFLKHPGPFDLRAFIEGPVHSFFLSQAFVERGQPWPFGEWNHGDDGKVEWWLEFFRSLPPAQFEGFVRLLGTSPVKGHRWCPCASGRRLRDCHLPLVRILRETPEDLRRRIVAEVQQHASPPARR
jgi:hypothetical protein